MRGGVVVGDGDAGGGGEGRALAATRCRQGETRIAIKHIIVAGGDAKTGGGVASTDGDAGWGNVIAGGVAIASYGYCGRGATRLGLGDGEDLRVALGDAG